ncbi:unnamed protein product [Lasius platythorax]|uniref:Uncharacterized protein n=1 Tax=Lasius platythorax TaxID=488582 RepID=A0AAV2NLV3_9HYME
MQIAPVVSRARPFASLSAKGTLRETHKYEPDPKPDTTISIGSLANDAKPRDKFRIQTTLVDLTVDEERGERV